MPLLPIDALILRPCGRADVRALLGKGGGHQVVVFGAPEVWVETFGIRVKKESEGGTNLEIQPEPGGAKGLTLHSYFTGGYRREVRVSVSQLLAAKAHVGKEAKASQKAIDPDQGGKQDWIACIIRTEDGKYHVRGMLRSALPDSLRGVSGMAEGRKVTRGALLDTEEAKVWKALLAHKAVLLFGPPGTGKTRLMLRVREAFEQGVPEISFDPADRTTPLKAVNNPLPVPPKRRVGFTTFHQSLTYENFVVGLRPTIGKSGMLIEPSDGLFLQLAGHALGKDSASLLLIDELNRGNAADVFGELITVLETDKRLDTTNRETKSTVTVRLPVPPANEAAAPGLTQDFRMPYHFYLLASMNSLDRSVAPLDSAMRRRFRIVHLAPRPDVAREVLLGEDEEVVVVGNLAALSQKEVGTIALKAWEHLNRAISRHWGPEFLLGHSYVLGIRDSQTLIEDFGETILPQIWELYRDRPADLADALRLDEAAEEDALAVQPEDASEMQIGLSQGTPVQPHDLASMAPEDALRRLYYLAFGKSWQLSEAGSSEEAN